MFSLRKPLASAILMVAVLAPLAGCSDLMGRADRYRPMPDLQKIGLRQLWERRIALAPREKIVHVWRVSDSIYVTTTDGQLARINATVGTLAWQIDLGNREYEIFRPADAPGGKNVLVVNRGKGFLIDKQTGDIAMQKTLHQAVTTDPIVSGTSFCVGGVERFSAMYIDILGGTKWMTPAPGDVFSARPAIEGDSAVLASESGKLWRVNLANGEWMWKDRKTDGRVVGGLASDGRNVFVPCLDNKVYCFDISSSAFLWSKPLQGKLDRSLYSTRSEVLVPASGKGLYALNSANGEVKWVADGVSEVGTIVRGHVWATDRGGNLVSLALDTGEAVSTTPVGAMAVTNNVDQLVVMVNSAGVVAAYAPMK